MTVTGLSAKLSSLEKTYTKEPFFHVQISTQFTTISKIAVIAVKY